MGYAVALSLTMAPAFCDLAGARFICAPLEQQASGAVVSAHTNPGLDVLKVWVNAPAEVHIALANVIMPEPPPGAKVIRKRHASAAGIGHSRW